MNQPAVAKVVKQRLDLPWRVEDIGGRAEDDQLRLLHCGNNRFESVIAAAVFLVAVDAGVAADADVGHIPRQIEFKQLTAALHSKYGGYTRERRFACAPQRAESLLLSCTRRIPPGRDTDDRLFCNP